METLDKNGIHIVAGHIVKKYGSVQYADGPRFKYSKKTWLISSVSPEGIFYRDENDEEVRLSCAEGIELVVIGSEGKGIFPEFQAIADDVVRISVGSVGLKYRALKDVESRNWKAGEIILIFGTVAREMLERGVIEQYDGPQEHQHVIVVATVARTTPAPRSPQ